MKRKYKIGRISFKNGIEVINISSKALELRDVIFSEKSHAGVNINTDNCKISNIHTYTDSEGFLMLKIEFVNLDDIINIIEKNAEVKFIRKDFMSNLSNEEDNNESIVRLWIRTDESDEIFIF